MTNAHSKTQETHAIKAIRATSDVYKVISLLESIGLMAECGSENNDVDARLYAAAGHCIDIARYNLPMDTQDYDRLWNDLNDAAEKITPDMSDSDVFSRLRDIAIRYSTNRKES